MELSPAENALETQFESFLQTIVLCVKSIHGLASGRSDRTAEKLKVVNEHLLEHQLRMQIWKQDCLVAENGLSASLDDKYNEESSRLRRLLFQTFQMQND